MRKKNLMAVVMCMVASLFSPDVLADFTKTLLILDARNSPELPRNFRMATAISPEMHIAGGAQFSELSLKSILERIHTKKMTVIDLREESHGFLNGNAVSWYGPQDAANAGKMPEDIENEQQALLAGLLEEETVTVNKVLKKTEAGMIESVKPVEFAVHQVASEAALANKYHLNYYRLYVQDFHGPTAQEVDSFMNIIRQIPSDQWIYVHCHAGVGRTTTFMALYDMINNAKHASFNEILKRQNKIGGKDLEIMPANESFKYQAAQDRLTFLRQFYDYARYNHDNFETSWSQWLAENEQEKSLN